MSLTLPPYLKELNKKKFKNQGTPQELVEALKERILQEAKHVATGVKISIYELVDMTKELVQLEATLPQIAEKAREEF